MRRALAAMHALLPLVGKASAGDGEALGFGLVLRVRVRGEGRGTRGKGLETVRLLAVRAQMEQP